MRIAFGLHLDGLQPEVPRTRAGAATLGPRGLLEVLETQLGLRVPAVHPSEAAFSYLKYLRDSNSPDRFYRRSLDVDEVNVARTLLDWREQWYEAGWDGTFPDGAPGRLADMAAVEGLAVDCVPPSVGERLRRVAETLSERTTQIERVELHTPFEDFPHAWQRVLEVLPCTPSPSLEIAALAPADSDLACVQTRLLKMARDELPGGGVRETLKGDGSLIVVKAASRDLSAGAIAEYLLGPGAVAETLVVAERDGVVLDNAFERAGLPRCGFVHHTRFRAATQVLKLVLALVWDPVDPHRILQLLLHRVAPLRPWVRSRLAGAVAESPGIGGPKWTEALRRIEQLQRERYEATDEDVLALRADIAYWLEGERHDARAGAPLDPLLARTQRVATWAAMRLNISESRTEAVLFAAAHAQAEALLAGLRDFGRERVPRLDLERLVDEVSTDAPDPSVFEEAGHARATASPAAVTRPSPTVIWWDLTPPPSGIAYPWSRRELAALRAAGVLLPEAEDLVQRRSREWLRPICSATERLILVVHDDERGAHPVWTQVKHVFDGIERIEVEPALFGGETVLGPLGVGTRPLPLKSLPVPRRWWSLPADCILARRETESYSSLEKLCDHPHEWVLQYAARLRPGRAANVMDGPRLFGNLGHRIFEAFFEAHQNWRGIPDAEVRRWVREKLPETVEREGAVLLGPARGVDRQRVTATLEQSLVGLLGHLRSAGIEHVSPEASREAQFEDCRLTGNIDLVLTRAEGERAVVDVKWAGEGTRRTLLADNRALQLATYAYLQRSIDENDHWPAGAFFILASANVIASEGSTFPDALVAHSKSDEGVADLWQRLAITCGWRWTQLERGRIEVVTDRTAPDDDSTPPEHGLAPVAGADPYDEFVHLTGWEDSR